MTDEGYLERVLKNGRAERNPDGSFDLFGVDYTSASILIRDNDTPYLPVKINKCHRKFDLYGTRLRSLRNCPNEVTGYFSFEGVGVGNLEGGPMIVDGEYYVCNNDLTSLKGVARKIGSGFRGDGNFSLTPYECRYLLLSQVDEILIDNGEIDQCLNHGRVNSIMPSELIPGKIRELKAMEKQYDPRDRDE